MELLFVALMVAKLLIIRMIGPHLILGIFILFTLIGYSDWLQTQYISLSIMMGVLFFLGGYFFLGSLFLQIQSLGFIAGCKSIYKEVISNWRVLKNAWRKQLSPFKKFWMIGGMGTIVLWLVCYYLTIYSWLASYLIAINWVTFFLALYDKNISPEVRKIEVAAAADPANRSLQKMLRQNKGRRVPEAILQAFGAFGGSGGLLIGIYLGRHKTTKSSFRIVTSVVILVWFLVGPGIYLLGGKLLEGADVGTDYSPAMLIWKTKYVHPFLTRHTQGENLAQLKVDKTSNAQKKQKVVSTKQKSVAKTGQNSTPPDLAADIQSARPFVTEVLEKIRCKPDDYWKQNALFATVAVPGINPSGFIGPWTGFKYPGGTCMEPVAIYGWAREHGEDDGSELSVQVKWRSSESDNTKQLIKLRKLPDLGWRVTRMRAR